MQRHIQIVKYIFTGGLATTSNLVILFIGVHYFQLWYLTAAIIAFCSAVIISYLLHKFWTFEDYSTYNIHTQFSAFFVFAIVMLGLNTLLMYIFVDGIGLWYLFAQALAAAVTACINYIYFNKVIFNNASENL